MRLLRLCVPLAGTLLLLIALPATAAAKGGCGHHTVTPQGNSEAEQYSETVPGPCGNQPANPGGSGGSSNNSVPPATLQQLQSQGAAGQNAAALAQAGAPAGGAKHGAGGGQGTGADNGQSSGGGAVSGIKDAF